MNLDIEDTSGQEIQPKRPFYEPGWYKELTNSEYHGSAGTSSSQLKTLLKHTPAHLVYGMYEPHDPSATMELGTAFHTLTLQPEEFDHHVSVLPELNLRKPDDRAEKQRIIDANPEKAIINAKQLADAQAMADAVRAHPTASILLQDIIAETSVYWWYKPSDPDDDEHYREMMKVRPDAVSRAHNVVIDLKSANDASYQEFQKSIINYGYHVSAAMYLEGINQNKELLRHCGHFIYSKFVFIVVENTPPHLVAVYELSPEFLQIGRRMFHYAANKLHKGRNEDWPGFPDDVRLIEPPPWADRGFIV